MSFMLKGVRKNHVPIEELNINKCECLTEDLSDKNRRNLKPKILLLSFSNLKKMNRQG